MSQTDLAEVSGIPKPTISRYENDHVSPSLQTLQRLATALGVTASSLLGVISPPDAFVHELMVNGVSFASTAEAVEAAKAVADVLKQRAQTG